ncbi:hypothetical protein F7R20_23000 [Pseudomonas brassicacearum subsp. brassicacearum]|nr:hypothetical protein F7R20_23000 [Pseudomonas brassicacearum subsp. brassicacearum]QEO76302.1 hypothetical protein ELZ14_01565 [Pseudomonas brassicacearum]
MGKTVYKGEVKTGVFAWFSCCQRQSSHPPVGASLLAIAVCQSTFILTGPPLSRAGSLPQGVSARHSWRRN